MLAVRITLACAFICAPVLAPLLSLHAAPGEDVTVPCKLLYEIADGIYVDAGKEAGFIRGAQGWLQYNGQPVARVEVESVTRGSTFLKVLSRPGAGLPESGSHISLIFKRVESRRDRSSPSSSSTLKDRTRKDAPLTPPRGRPDIDAPPIDDGSRPGEDAEAETAKLPGEVPAAKVESPDTAKSAESPASEKSEPFVPLLAPPDLGELALTDAFNLFHGRIALRELYQVASDDQYSYSITQLRSSGSLERIQATPWELDWDGSVSYRAGQALEDGHDFEEPRLEVYRLSLFRRFEDRSTFRVGRFVPLELPSVGFLDGVQGEKVVNDSFRAGAMLGFKPTRENVDVSIHEPTAVLYGTLEAHSRDATAHYSGTAGVLASLYKGKPDRLAVLVDQTARLGELSLFASSELDFDIGGAEVRDGVRITRLDAYASYPVLDWLTLRSGVDRFERVDTGAENDDLDLLILDEAEFLDRGFWRYWAGAGLQLPLSFRLTGEVSLTDSERDDFDVRGLVSLSRFGLPGLPSASATLTIYNLLGSDVEGYGGRLSAHVPLQQHRIYLEPSVAFRYSESDLDHERFEFTDFTLRAHWIISRSWRLSGAVSYADTDDIQRVLVDLGLTFSW